MFLNLPIYLLFFLCLVALSHAIRPEEGSWSVVFDEYNELHFFSKSLFKGTRISIKIHCNELYYFSVNWILKEHECPYDYLNLGHYNIREPQLQEISNDVQANRTSMYYVRSDDHKYSCANDIHLENLSTYEINNNTDIQPMQNISDLYTVYTIQRDGIYLFTLNIKNTTPDGNKPNHINEDDKFFAIVEVAMRSPYGYLSATNWPLLNFYRFMCFVYICFGLTWLILLFMQWTDLLQIQFWIGTVILLGMVEKAAFYAEYYELNSTGRLDNIYGLMIMAEVISCIKRTLARALLIIVCLGFGIVKPRLGPLLPKVLGLSSLYLTMSLMESYFRLSLNMSSKVLLVDLPLTALDSFIVCWIFAALTETTRALRLRRNTVKLQLRVYTHLKNVLGFAVVASTSFIMYSIKTLQHITNCDDNRKEQWLDEAFWHIEFSIILLVIMILNWRLTNSKQRYAFTPLLDALDDDTDEIVLFTKETYNDVKVRTTSGNTSNQQNSVTPFKDYLASNNTSSTKSQTHLDDDLKWLEENIPGSLYETTVPILDYSEDDHNTAIEWSKLL